jgi:hypothetical protein
VVFDVEVQVRHQVLFFHFRSRTHQEGGARGQEARGRGQK